VAVIPQQPVMGLINSYAPQVGSAVARFDAALLGLPAGTVIPDAPAIVESNALMVAGYNHFLFLISASSTGGTNGSLIVEYCDPVTEAVVASATAIAFVLGGAALVPVPWGATALLVATDTTGAVFFTIKLALQTTGGAGGGLITGVPRPPNLYCSQR
jgi:hypothetical protein